LDELEEDMIEDDEFELGFSEDVLEDALEDTLRGSRRGNSQEGKVVSEVSKVSKVSKVPVKGRSRFILDGQVNATADMMQRKPWSEQYPPAGVAELAVHKKKVDDVQSWLAAALSGRSGNVCFYLSARY
jgi:cell cycle checkpoint protein